MNGQRVREFMSRGACVQKSYKLKFSNIVAYPQNDVRELAKIMADIKIDSIPVLFSPWNKELIGFVEFNKIQMLLSD